MCGADSAGVDPAGVPVALCSCAPDVYLQKVTGKHETPIQALHLQNDCGVSVVTDSHRRFGIVIRRI